MTARKTILFVPGKRPKPAPEIHQRGLWRALLAGIARVNEPVAQALAADPACFRLVAWNALFYREARMGDDAPDIDALLRQTGPTAADIREAHSWRTQRARLLYSLADLMPFVIPLLPDAAVRSTVSETRRYFDNQGDIARTIRELLKARLRECLAAGESVLLIGHSMGSIIAYDALWELWHEEHNHAQIDCLLTIGSPLGMRYVRDRLVGFRDRTGRRFPGNVRVWKNVATQGDLTALDPSLRDDFSPMLALGTESIEDIHEGVYGYFRNEDGLNVHRSYGYLVQPVVGQIIADWWSHTISRPVVPPAGAKIN